ncbi:glycosyltransferase family 2 protein [Muribaculum intestinale]|uniref:glycosyltransferase family 2 protein n=1 Tax=Muribaculum intestinale TaxID=1796646 RepID=UPI0025A94938|nr:glycosyltransferase family 2 protein [Muribaculum intestinale]
MTIAVLITVHNRKEKTLACLRNLFNQKLPDKYEFNVYLTDDGCTDGTQEAVLKEFPTVNIIHGDGSLFWNRGMYAAWCEAEKKDHAFFLWLNDDTFLLKDSIKNLLIESSNFNNQAIIIGATLSSNEDKITYSGWKNRIIIDPRIDNRESDYFSGNIVLIPQKVYSILGKNDPYYIHTIGDTDYGLRATKAGIKNIVCPTICGICDNHPTKPKWMDSSVKLHERWTALYSIGGNGANPIQFFHFKRKHYGLLSAIVTFITNHIHVIFPKLWKG